MTWVKKIVSRDGIDERGNQKPDAEEIKIRITIRMMRGLPREG